MKAMDWIEWKFLGIANSAMDGQRGLRGRELFNASGMGQTTFVF